MTLDRATDGGAPEIASPSEACLNCGADLVGPFCSRCGQPADVRARPAWRFVLDGAEELLSIEGRLFRGLRDTLLRPGHLTKEYFRGRRVRHLHPIRLLLVASAIAYATYAWVGADRAGLLLALGDLIAGGGGDAETVTVVVLLFLLTAAGQRLVYRGSGRLYVEHVVLVVHAASFGMLLAPVEALVFHVVPPDVGGGIQAAVAPIIPMYWVLALREVFDEALPLTLLRAAGVVAATAVLFVAVMLLVDGVGAAVSAAM